MSIPLGQRAKKHTCFSKFNETSYHSRPGTWFLHCQRLWLLLT